MVNALIGNNSAHVENDCHGKEILSLIALQERNDPPASDIADHLDAALKPRSTLLGGHHDPLAQLLCEDFLEICSLEGGVPRREWLFFLAAYLRIATAMWMLAHLQATVFLRDWLLDACERSGRLPTLEKVQSKLVERYKRLLHPSSSPTREVAQHVENYMQSRVELRLMVQELEGTHSGKFRSASGDPRRLSLTSEGASWLPLSKLLELARGMEWPRITGGERVRLWLTRSAEGWPAWRSPRARGQGKNIDEFLRVLRLDADDSGSGLLDSDRRGAMKIVPGHRLLQLFAFLATKRKVRAKHPQDGGKLVLRDIESHLYEYGIDFRSSSYGRPLLMEKLVEGGLLVGSPDAGESAEVLNPVGN